MQQSIINVTLVVRDYDEAIAFYTQVLGFTLVEDTDLGGGKRWVRVAPPGSSGTSLLLAQATSRAYMSLLMDHKVRASMGEIGNCYDNIYAERVIGTLKNEYLLGDRFVDQRQVQTATRQAVYAYNTDRPHLSLNYGIPIEAYFGSSLSISPVLIPEKVS